jgi:hypothetical protein
LIACDIHEQVLKMLFAESENLFTGKVARDNAARLWAGQNPFDPLKQVHQHRAVQLAIGLKESAPEIYKKLLRGSQRQKPHLGLGAAYSAFATSRERDGHQSFELKDGVLSVGSGAGKARTRLIENVSCKKTTAENTS